MFAPAKEPGARAGVSGPRVRVAYIRSEEFDIAPAGLVAEVARAARCLLLLRLTALSSSSLRCFCSSASARSALARCLRSACSGVSGVGATSNIVNRLSNAAAGEARLKSLLAPYPADDMICWPVSARVGNVRNNDSSLIEPVATV